jgi:hypothetical protein
MSRELRRGESKPFPAAVQTELRRGRHQPHNRAAKGEKTASSGAIGRDRGRDHVAVVRPLHVVTASRFFM